MSNLIDLVAGLPAGPAQQLLDLGVPVHVPSGGTVFRLGEPAERIFVIERGRIALTMPMQVGGQQEAVLVEDRQAGETIGWSALIPPHRFTLNATAPIDADLLAIPRLNLVEYLEANPSIAYLVTRNVSELTGRRLQVFQAMWLREMQRGIERRLQTSTGAA